MSTESDGQSVPATGKKASSQDCSGNRNGDRDALIGALAKRLPIRLSPEFAERYGSDVLLCMGVVLFLFGCRAVVLAETTSGALLVTTAVIVVVVAAGLRRLVAVKLNVLRLIEFLATFGARGKDGDGPDEG
jgi:hypothetical protein